MAATDRAALIALQSSTGGTKKRPNYDAKPRIASWNTNAAPATWEGVKVNGEGRVVRLDLTFGGLEGSIPASLGDLTELEDLLLSNNRITGLIPEAVGRLNKLWKLDAGNNKLAGPIPESLGYLSQLRGLFLNNNGLTEPIPEALGRLGKLEMLNLENNKLSGSIPKSLGALSKLNWLLMSTNGLDGPIPDELGCLGKLWKLNLDNNKLTGPIPDSLGALSTLNWLSLSNNRLTGRIPEALGRLSRLGKLDLGNNKLTEPIPEALGNLTMLKELRLSDNGLTGLIPKTLGHLSDLHTLDLSGNILRGLVPEALGDLSNLESLRLKGNNLRGPLPEKLRKHARFGAFETGLAMDGPPLPPLTGDRHALKVVILPVVLGYADLASDLFTAVSYKSDHPVWFWLGLTFALAPAVILAGFFLSDVKEYRRRFFVATQLSLLYEAKKTVEDEEYSPVLALVRVVEPLFESVPQLLLQLYAMLRLWTETSGSPTRFGWRVGSVCISTASLAYAATDLSSVERLVHQTGGDNDTADRFSLCPRFPSITAAVFSRVPKKGTPAVLKGFGPVHPRNHVWLCFLYHVLEIVARFVSLAMLLLVLRGWFFFVLPYLWISRGLVVWVAAWVEVHLGNLDAAHKALDFRFRLRLVAMPFLDSVVDGTVARGSALALTLIEFVFCVTIYRFYTRDDVSASARLTLTWLASGCMVGKMFLAWLVIVPLTLKGFQSGGKTHASFRNETGNAAVAGDSEAGVAEVSNAEGGMIERGSSKPSVVEGPVRL